MIEFTRKDFFFILIFYFVLFLFHLQIVAQTYVSPFVGWQFTKIESDNGDFDEYWTVGKTFSTNNAVVGLRIDHRILQNIYLSANFNYSVLVKEATSLWIVPVDHVKMKSVKGSIQANYLYKKLSIGGGVYLNNILDITTVMKDIEDKGNYENLKDYGIRWSLGLLIDRLEIELFSYLGLNEPQSRSQGIEMSPWISFGCQVGYNIPIKLFGNKESYSCPKF